jgi:putative FmdB family regulatory protein
MPLYEYRCRQCGHRFEVLQRLGEGGDGVPCPQCQAQDAEKQLSTFATSGAKSSAAAGPPACGGPT